MGLLGHHFLLLLHVQQPSHPSSVPHTLFLHRRFLLFGIFDSSSDEILIFPAFLFSRAVSFVVFSSREQRNFSFSSFFLLHLHHDRAANLSAHVQHVRETVYKSNARRQIAYQARRGWRGREDGDSRRGSLLASDTAVHVALHGA